MKENGVAAVANTKVGASVSVQQSEVHVIVLMCCVVCSIIIVI